MMIIISLLVAMILWAIISYNHLVRDRQRVLTAWSDIDVQLKRGEHYRPVWYHGHHWQAQNLGDFSNSLGNSLSSALVS